MNSESIIYKNLYPIKSQAGEINTTNISLVPPIDVSLYKVERGIFHLDLVAAPEHNQIQTQISYDNLVEQTKETYQNAQYNPIYRGSKINGGLGFQGTNTNSISKKVVSDPSVLYPYTTVASSPVRAVPAQLSHKGYFFDSDTVMMTASGGTSDSDFSMPIASPRTPPKSTLIFSGTKHIDSDAGSSSNGKDFKRKLQHYPNLPTRDLQITERTSEPTSASSNSLVRSNFLEFQRKVKTKKQIRLQTIMETNNELATDPSSSDYNTSGSEYKQASSSSSNVRARPSPIITRSKGKGRLY